MAKPKAQTKEKDEVQISVRLTAELHRQVTDAAEEDDRSVNSYVVRLIKERMAERDAAKPERKAR